MTLRRLKNLAWLSPLQQKRVRKALAISIFEKRGIVFDEVHSHDTAYILLSGIVRITCRNRKGSRTLVNMVAPGMIPGFPPSVRGIFYDFRCEALTRCEIGTIDLETLVGITLGIRSETFKLMSSTYVGSWDIVRLRCPNYMSWTVEERLALVLMELGENFGISEGSGIRFPIAARHQDLADLVSASRPRITEHLLEFERKRLIRRLDHRFVIRPDRLAAFLARPRRNAEASAR